MLNPRKQQIPPIRMQKLGIMPGIGEIERALEQAKRQKARIIELPFSIHRGVLSFVLQVTIESLGSDPSWKLFLGDGPNAKVLWTFYGPSIPIIFDKVVAACDEQELKLEAGDKTYANFDIPSIASNNSFASPSLSNNDLSSVGDMFSTGTFSRSKSILEGDLTNMQVPTLFQSISMGKMTGMLVIENRPDIARIYFVDGAPVHAICRDTSGDLALVELITWEQGLFHFFQNESTKSSSITRRLDSILMEGVSLLDQHRFVVKAGLTPESYLIRKDPKISEKDFEAKVALGAPLDMSEQKRFYQSVDSRKTFFDLLREKPMHMSQWVPLMFNMLSCGLLELTEKAPFVDLHSQETGADTQVISSALRQMQRVETGLFTYPVFLFLFEQEFLKAQYFGMPMALLIIEMRMRMDPDSSNFDPLQSIAVREVGKRITALKRPIDLFGHYEMFDCALVLPNTDSQGASLLASRVVEVLMGSPLLTGTSVHDLQLHVGVASAPADARDIGLLCKMAKASIQQVKESGLATIGYARDLRR